MFKSDRCGIEILTTHGVANPTWSFKSDRCGIEIITNLFFRIQHILFKSDRCGIEIIAVGTGTTAALAFKSDRCGIEIPPPAADNIHELRSNQTVAGLKSDYELEAAKEYSEVQIRPLRD